MPRNTTLSASDDEGKKRKATESPNGSLTDTLSVLVTVSEEESSHQKNDAIEKLKVMMDNNVEELKSNKQDFEASKGKKIKILQDFDKLANDVDQATKSVMDLHNKYLQNTNDMNAQQELLLSILAQRQPSVDNLKTTVIEAAEEMLSHTNLWKTLFGQWMDFQYVENAPMNMLEAHGHFEGYVKKFVKALKNMDGYKASIDSVFIAGGIKHIDLPDDHIMPVGLPNMYSQVFYILIKDFYLFSFCCLVPANPSRSTNVVNTKRLDL